MEEPKKTLSFGFSKVKTKTAIIKNESTKAFESVEKKSDQQIELITSIEGKKLKSLNKNEDETLKRPVVIPCQQNTNILEKKREDKKRSEDLEKRIKELEGKAENKQELEALKALFAETLNKNKDQSNAELKIPMNPNETEQNTEKKTLEEIEDANYDQIDLEKFGVAALRGMGWSEKNGIGLTNKRTSDLIVPELRPKGLGLGAGFNKKGRPDDDNRYKQQTESNLTYKKGAFLKIIDGKHRGEYAELVSFDDGLNRILVRLQESDQTVSMIQSLTQLISRSEYEKAQKRKN
jgi:G patch domain/KOW motif-containing protein